MSGARKANDGDVIGDHPCGIPCFYSGDKIPKVVASNVWEFLKYKVSGTKDAVAFVDQAFEFFEAASNSLTSSRPLLYYYSFMNLAKAFLIFRKVEIPLLAHHGIRDPKTNEKKRLEFKGQKVNYYQLTADHSNVFPEFVKELSGIIISQTKDVIVLNLMAQIPGIHKTYCDVTNSLPRFAPVQSLNIHTNGRDVWARLKFNFYDMDADVSMKGIRVRPEFSSVFHRVQTMEDGMIWYETDPIPGQGRGRPSAIDNLCKVIVKCGVWSILISREYKYYLGNFQRDEIIPQLASIYAVMFYLGSITRYKPQYFDKIVANKYAWLVGEFIETQPTQFLYILASTIARTEVIKPWATISG